MWRGWLALGMVVVLAACSGNPDCLPAVVPTLTPRVSLPTATPVSKVPIGTETPIAPPCATRTPRPTLTPRPALSSGAGLSERSGVAHSVGVSPNPQRLASVFADGARHAWVAYTSNGQMFVQPIGGGQAIAVGDIAQVVVAFGPDEAALIDGSPTGLRWRISPQWSDWLITAPRALPFSSTDLAASYGAEGWLYVATGGQISRWNAFGAQWEYQGSYTGQVRQLVRLADGRQVLLSSEGVWARTPNTYSWIRTWAGDAPALAVLGNRLMLAWRVGEEWRVVISADGGQNWSAPEIAARAPTEALVLDGGSEAPVVIQPGRLGDPYPALLNTDAMEVIGLYGEADGFTFPVVYRRQSDGTWFPPYGQLEPLSRAGTARNARNFRAVSENGTVAIAWEESQYNGAFNVVALIR